MLPLTACPVDGGPTFSSRELVLKCETYGLMQPRPRLMRALMPALRRLEPYEVLLGNPNPLPLPPPPPPPPLSFTPAFT